MPYWSSSTLIDWFEPHGHPKTFQKLGFLASGKFVLRISKQPVELVENIFVDAYPTHQKTMIIG